MHLYQPIGELSYLLNVAGVIVLPAQTCSSLSSNKTTIQKIVKARNLLVLQLFRETLLLFRTIDCHFVGEITARAFITDREKNPEEEFRKLLKVFVRAQGVISKAIVYLIYCYIWPRLGRF